MTRLLLISAVMVSILGRYSYLIADNEADYVTYYYLSNAVGWLLAISSIHSASIGITKIIAEGAMILAFGEVIDEVLLTATETQMNEVYLLILVLIWTTYRFIKKDRSDRRKTDVD